LLERLVAHWFSFDRVKDPLPRQSSRAVVSLFCWRGGRLELVVSNRTRQWVVA